MVEAYLEYRIKVICLGILVQFPVEMKRIKGKGEVKDRRSRSQFESIAVFKSSLVEVRAAFVPQPYQNLSW